MTIEAQIVGLLLRMDARQRQIFKQAALGKLSGQRVGDVVWRVMADLDSDRKLRDHRVNKGQA